MIKNVGKKMGKKEFIQATKSLALAQRKSLADPLKHQILPIQLKPPQFAQRNPASKQT